jgi:transposase
MKTPTDGPFITEVTMDSFAWFVGIDWGTEVHQVCLIDATRSVIETRRVAHDVAAVQDCLTWILTRSGVPADQVAVAIETPRGALVETLLERGVVVFAINPKQLDRFRDRFTVAGAKDDRRDAEVLADSLRTDRHAFRRVQVDDSLIIQLRELARAEEALTCDLRRLTNRLRDQVYRTAPALLRLCPAADEAWFWTLLEHASTPAAQRGLSRAAVQQVLQTHRIRRLTPVDVLTALQAPPFTLAPGVVEATRDAIELLLPQLRVVDAQCRRCVTRQTALLTALQERPATETEPGQYRDVEILTSLPGVGRMVAVTILAEAASLLAARDYHRIRAQAGSAPVTDASGKRRWVKMRRACCPRLRQAFYHWARVSLQRDPASAAYYQQLRHRGHTHGRALRSVADRCLRTLMAMLTHRTLYDPTHPSRCATAPVPA